MKWNLKNKKNPRTRDPFQRKPKSSPNPERLTDNGTLDTYPHRLEILDEKNRTSDNLTRETSTKRTHNQNLIINKADEGSTIVVEDRDDYISNTMEQLNNPNIYKPLNDDISNDLKHSKKLDLLFINGLMKRNRVAVKPHQST